MWYSKAKALLHPNLRFREPFGLAPVEAQACGLPVIAFDNGAMRETIADGTGWTLKTLDDFVGTLGLLESVGPRFLESMRSKCRQNALRFTVGNMARRLDELCQEAVEKGGW